MRYTQNPTKKFKGAFLKLKNKPVIITFHSFGDVDACASAIAIKEFLGPKAIIAVQDTVNSFAKTLFLEYVDKFVKFSQAKQIHKDAKIILLDCNHKSLLKKEIEDVDFLIDHHAFSADSVKAKNYYVWPEASSTSELVVKLIKPDQKTAKFLIFGILTDSSFLTYANAQTFYIVYRILKENNLDFEKILSEIDIAESSKKRMRILEALKDVKFFEFKGYICSLAIVESYESIIAEHLIRIGSDVAFIASEKKDECIISARMHKRNLFKVDLLYIIDEIAKTIEGNGGGHPLAAAASGKNKNNVFIALEKAKELFFRQLE